MGDAPDGEVLSCDARNAGHLCSLGCISANSWHFRGVERWLFALFLLCLVYGRRHLRHLTTAFENRTLLNYQRRSLDVAIHFCSPAEFKALSGNNIAVDGAVNNGYGNFDIGINFSICADNERATAGADAPRQMPIYSHHRFKIGFAG